MTLWTAPECSFTIEEFKRLPLEGRRWELLDGRVVQMEPHYFAANLVTGHMLGLVWSHVEAYELGWVLGPGCGFRLWPGRETVRVTDVSFTRHDRVPDRKEWGDFPRNAPDLTIEVLSSAELTAPALDRIAMFLAAGTLRVWFVDPETRAVTVFHPDRGPEMLSVGDTLRGDEVLLGFSVPVEEIFSDLDCWTE